MEIPKDAIIIEGSDGETVGITVNHAFPDGAGIAVKHMDSETSQLQCDVYPAGNSIDVEAMCFEGTTTATVIVYFGAFNEEDCTACSVDEISAMGENYCAYNIEIDCEPMSVDCGEPTGAPSASPSASPTKSPAPSDSPSASPSKSPTKSPTTSPSDAPSASPTASPTVSAAPTMCTEPMPPKIVGQVCAADMDAIDMPEGAITINELLDNQVGVTINQSWSQNDIGLAVRNGLDTCVVNGDVEFGTSQDFTSDCIEGYATLTVVAYVDDTFNPNDCEACNAEDINGMGGDYQFCAYKVEIPCETVDVPCGEPSAAPSGSFYPSSAPTSSPTVSMAPSSSPTYSCPENAELVAIDGEYQYDGDIPIVVLEQTTTQVTFKVENKFGQEVTNFFTEYHSGNFGETECVQEENIPINGGPEEFTAYCMHNVEISIVNFWVRDCDTIEETTFLGDLDVAEIPECCHPPDEECKVVQYTFKLHCVDQCPDDTARRNLNQVDPHKLIEEKKKQEASTKAFEELTGHAEENDADDHFCVVEDYPCGADLDKVNVCHYSARDGYKTFCVPESDSDALRFYPKDYCGPCVGGYATA